MAAMTLTEYRKAYQERKHHPLNPDAHITLTVREMINHEHKRAAEILIDIEADLRRLWAEEVQRDATLRQEIDEALWQEGNSQEQACQEARA